MALTEPRPARLQNVQLKATLGTDASGAERRQAFITTAAARCRSCCALRGGTTDARASMFLYERDEHMKIRRLEDKLGIHGSPTCELQFDEAPRCSSASAGASPPTS